MAQRNAFNDLMHGKPKKANPKKVEKVMHEFKEGNLHSGSGGKVADRKQAIAIALSEGRKHPNKK